MTICKSPWLKAGSHNMTVVYTGTTPVFTVCQKVISVFYSLISEINRDGILLRWTGSCDCLPEQIMDPYL